MLQLAACVNDTAIFQTASSLPKNIPGLLAVQRIRCYEPKLKLITALIPVSHGILSSASSIHFKI